VRVRATPRCGNASGARGHCEGLGSEHPTIKHRLESEPSDTLCSRMACDWKILPWATQLCGITANPGGFSRHRFGYNQEASGALDRRPSQGSGDGFVTTDDSGTGRGVCRRAGSHQTDGVRRDRPQPVIRAPRSEAHRSTPKRKTSHYHRDPVVWGAR